ncbi:MAG: type II restriction endonuclease [Paludibacteraceae bacterium]
MIYNFELFLSQLKRTNATLDGFTDFKKVSANVGKIAIKLNQLNYLLGKTDLHTAIKDLFDENPLTFEILEILVAVRKSDKKMVLNKDFKPQLLEDYFTTADGVIEYIEGTGLADVFRSKKITNLVDYVFGIEVGLDTNARKNRGGHNMEHAVAKIFTDAGIHYRTEVYSNEFADLKSLGGDLKRFDFVVETPVKTYLIETNFYNSGGSKLNEVARSYSELAPKINQYPAYEFVWITDGQGWLSAKNKLEEAFSIIPSLYNLTSLTSFIEKIQYEEKTNKEL